MPTESELTVFVVAVIVGTSVGLLVQRVLSRRRPVEVEAPEWATSAARECKPDRLCGRDCGAPDELHIDPEPDWVGNVPFLHGQSDTPVPGTEYLYDFDDGRGKRPVPLTNDMYCLCGHPNHLTCPEPDSLLGMQIERGPDWESGWSA